MKSKEPINRTIPTKNYRWVFLVGIIHLILAYSLWFLLFITKWFPYGALERVRDWLYRFF